MPLARKSFCHSVNPKAQCSKFKVQCPQSSTFKVKVPPSLSRLLRHLTAATPSLIPCIAGVPQTVCVARLIMVMFGKLHTLMSHAKGTMPRSPAYWNTVLYQCFSVALKVASSFCQLAPHSPMITGIFLSIKVVLSLSNCTLTLLVSVQVSVAPLVKFHGS